MSVFVCVLGFGSLKGGAQLSDGGGDYGGGYGYCGGGGSVCVCVCVCVCVRACWALVLSTVGRNWWR